MEKSKNIRFGIADTYINMMVPVPASHPFGFHQGNNVYFVLVNRRSEFKLFVIF